jgi:hypothetical protein
VALKNLSVFAVNNFSLSQHWLYEVFMNIARLKYAVVTTALMSATAASQAATLINEGFESFAGLAASGWVLTNASVPTGASNFFAGNTAIFDAQSGTAGSYVGGNFDNAAAGGTINNWLITRSFSTEAAGSVEFWARAEVVSGFSDSIAFGLSNGSSAITAFTLGSAVTLSGNWTKYSLNFAAQGAGSSGRFAVNYSGPADTSNYIGIDSVVVTAVPEPTTWLMMCGGLLGLGAVARRRKAN